MVKRVLPPASSPMIRRSSGEQAAMYIRRLIFDGELRPGARVPQDEIAQTLGWSEAKVKIRAFRARQSLRKQAERMLVTGRSKEQ